MRTLRRFPYVLAIAALGTIVSIVIVEQERHGHQASAYPVLFAALLGVPFLVALKLFAEKRRWSIMRITGLQLTGVILLAAYAWSLPVDTPAAPAIHMIRFLMLVTGMHLLVAVSPWLGRGQENGFWHFNRILFLRLLTAALFSHVLYAGLAIALAAVENLFEVNIPGERYLQLWILLTGMFMTWFFLSGIPSDLQALDRRDDYPKGLKIFAQYVLLPLVVIYLVILVAYSAKIIVSWEWPYGWVSRLILGFSAAGMFSLLLLHPIRERSDSAWIAGAARWFFLALAPLLVMYFLAVMRRLSDYGITEARYLGIVVGIWLVAMTLHFLFTRGMNIKFIPLSLCALAFLVSVGPWGAFSVSESSQVGRIRTLLEEHQMIADDTVRPARANVGINDRREISAVLDYLHDVHGYGAIERWFTEPLRVDSTDSRSAWKVPGDVAGMLGIEFVSAPRMAPGGLLTYSVSPSAVMIVEGYDRVLPRHAFSRRSEKRTFTAGQATLVLNSTLDTLTLMLSDSERDDHVSTAATKTFPDDTAAGVRDAEMLPVDTLMIPLHPVTDALLAEFGNAGAADVPLERTAVEAASSRLKVKVYLPYLQLTRDDAVLHTEMLRVRVMYGKKE